MAGMEFSSNNLAVPPDERISTPKLESERAKSIIPDLFDTLINARDTILIIIILFI